MKKLVGTLLTLSMAGVFAVSAFAANTTGGSTTVSTDIAPAYTVTIPEKLQIPYNSTEAETLMLTASGLLLENGKTVTVTAAGSGPDGMFSMANGSDTLTYELSKEASPWSAVAKDSELASFPENGTRTIYAKVPDWSVTAAGKYSGTITFTVSYQ